MLPTILRKNSSFKKLRTHKAFKVVYKELETIIMEGTMVGNMIGTKKKHNGTPYSMISNVFSSCVLTLSFNFYKD